MLPPYCDRSITARFDQLANLLFIARSSASFIITAAMRPGIARIAPLRAIANPLIAIAPFSDLTIVLLNTGAILNGVDGIGVGVNVHIRHIDIRDIGG